MIQATAYTPLDFALADFLTDRSELFGEQRTRFNEIVLSLSSAQSSGHNCISLNDVDLALVKGCRLVHLSEFNSSPAALILETTSQPLVLEYSNFYLNRYWHYETRLVANITQRINQKSPRCDNKALLDKYFPQGKSSTETDWQREAAKSASEQVFTIITGGPGTGKTTTVLKVLALLQELHKGELAISLAAPTGKAAMRLQQSLQEGKRELALKDQSLLDSIPEQVSTLHRLLGPIKQSNQFRHNADKPLSCDLLVVDESSMIDLAMMGKLMDALSPSARLILLGDKDQLTSVESGAVLNDLCLSLPEQTIELQKTWRFSGPIKDLAVAVNTQRAEEAWALLTTPHSQTKQNLVNNSAEKKPLSKMSKPLQYSLFDGSHDEIPAVEQSDKAVTVNSINLIQADWQTHIVEQYQDYIEYVKADNNPEVALTTFSRFQVLAAIRQGEFGVEGINRSIEKQINSSRMQTHQPWYHGKPVMITRNDPSLQLFNGDIGICLHDDDRSQLKVWFKQSDGGFRAIIPARLPQHETAYAMTIHKSQGSEFDDVMLVLPDKSAPLLSKELLYTGITRAKQRVDIVASESVFTFAVNQRVIRNSGIKSKFGQQG